MGRSSGISAGGPASLTSAPRRGSSLALERATRLWRMSPQIAILRPSIRPRRWRMVAASSRAWVGCSLVPSPALITGASTISAVAAAAPLSRWRMTSASGRIALSVRAVSSSVSPFLTELCSIDSDNGGRAEPRGRGRERHRGAGRILIEQVEDDLAGQRVLGRPARFSANQWSARSRIVAIWPSVSESMLRMSTSASLIAAPKDWPVRRWRLAGYARRRARRLSRRAWRG